MKVYSVSLSLFLLFLHCHCMAVLPCANCRSANANSDAIIRVVTEAVGYSGWVCDPDYKSELALYFKGQLLADIIDSVELFRDGSTDWHTLTFIKNCHIVYNDGIKALVLATMEETGPEGLSGQMAGTFTLHKTSGGWRITGMHIFRHNQNET